MKIGVALSGGIDSAFTLFLLKEKGYNLMAFTFDHGYLKREYLFQAERIAKFLGIKHWVIDVKNEFQKIVDFFVESYKRGKTPNPCVLCNREIKFGIFLKKILHTFDCNKIATGHYVKIKNLENFKVITRGKDERKEQSYFLSLINPEVLDYVMFPLGDFTKEEIFSEVKKVFPDDFLFSKESQDVCFFDSSQKEGLKNFLKNQLGEKKGEVVYKGKTVGFHWGYFFYTIGQRKGLGIPLGKPVYVCEIIPDKNWVILGEKEELLKEGLFLEKVNLFLPWEMIARMKRERKDCFFIKVRYKSPFIKIREFFFEDGKLRVIFENPYGPVAPGQVGAIYLEDHLILGGIIESSF